MLLKPGREARVRAGHPWIFQGEIARLLGQPENGDVVEVCEAKGPPVGQGYWNARSQISVRLWAFPGETLDDALVEKRLEASIRAREELSKVTDAVRLVHAEADGMPGLIVDRYADVIVVQSLSLAVEQRLPLIARLLDLRFRPKVIYARGDSGVRKLEGLPLESRPLRGGDAAPCPVPVREHGLTFLVDWKKGQKTGFFLDQRENRRRVAVETASLVARLDHPPDVLDLFCHTGGFAVAAAAAGAAAVLGIDSSTDALKLAAANARENGFAQRIGFQDENVFEAVRELARARRKYDVVIVDPPSFAKSRTQLAGARRGYLDVNLFALRLVRPGGRFFTFSCSQAMPAGEFLDIVRAAAGEAHVRARVLSLLGQADDHPQLLHVPETAYLKGALLQVL